MILTALIASVALTGTGAGSDESPPCRGSGPDAAAVCAVLQAQQTAWNAGDIPGFMEGYWQSEALRFASGGTVTTGWQATLDRYLARYGDDAAMGDLVFSGVDVDQLSSDRAIAFGRWQLLRESDAPSGLFTLVFAKTDGAWVIVHDHTSSAAQ